MTIEIRRMAWQDKREQLLRAAYVGAFLCAFALVASAGYVLTHDTDRQGWFLTGAPIVFGVALVIQLRAVWLEGFPVVQYAGRGIAVQWFVFTAACLTGWVDPAGTVLLWSAQGLGVSLGSLRLLRAYSGPNDEEQALIEQLGELSTEDESDDLAATFDDAPPARRELADAVREHRARSLAWALAAAAVASSLALPVDSDLRVFLSLSTGLGLACALWKLHDTWLARRASRQAETASSYERVWVAQIAAPGQQIRPLLAVWTQAPATTSEIPRPDQVWLCDDDATDLQSSSTFLGVHEAWAASGSTPCFVAADRGVAILHRRALLSFGMQWRAKEFTIQRLHRPSPDHEVDRGAALPKLVDSRILMRVAGRVALMAGLAGLVWAILVR